MKPLLIGQLQRKVYHRVCQSLICSSEKSEPHLFPYSRVVVRFVACCGYNVDRCSFAPKDGVSRQKTRPNVLLPINLLQKKEKDTKYIFRHVGVCSTAVERRTADPAAGDRLPTCAPLA